MAGKSASDYHLLDTPEVLRFLFHPRQTPGPVDGHGRFEEVWIAMADGIRVGARFFMHRFDHATLLFFHGNGEIAADYDDIAPLFNRAGVNFVVADYRGYGCSQGRPTASSMMTDCHRILDYVDRWKADNGYTGPTLVMGRSLGSASALELAHTHADRLAGLIIESGFARTGPLLRRLGAPWQPLGSGAGRGFANIDKIRTFRNPTLIIHAEFDRIIPFSEGQAPYDASGAEEKRLVKIPGADHNDIFFRGMAPYLKAVADLTRKLG